MRGKHGIAAEKRRTVAELEERAGSAEHRADKAEAALAELREKNGRQIAGLRAEVARAIKERDSSVSPALAESTRALDVARNSVSVLAMERDKLQKVVDRYDRDIKQLASIFGRALEKAGLDLDQVMAVMSGLELGGWNWGPSIKAMQRLSAASGEDHMPEVVQ